MPEPGVEDQEAWQAACDTRGTRLSMERVVFLDVDGVLHSLYGDDIFQQACCQELERIVRTTGATIVLSSSWRTEPEQIAMINLMLAQRGLAAISDCTEVLDSEHGRAEEITKWLDQHPETATWVALDDLDLEQGDHVHAQRLTSHFVRTAQDVGLTSANADEAIAILARLGESRLETCYSRFAAAFQDKDDMGTAPAVVLECIHAAGLPHLPQMPVMDRCLAFGHHDASWIVGRQAQGEFLSKVVPDENIRNCISRAHIELQVIGSELYLRRRSQYSVLLNGRPVIEELVRTPAGSLIGFHMVGMLLPFLSFCVHVRELSCCASDCAAEPQGRTKQDPRSCSTLSPESLEPLARVASPQRAHSSRVAFDSAKAFHASQQRAPSSEDALVAALPGAVAVAAMSEQCEVHPLVLSPYDKRQDTVSEATFAPHKLILTCTRMMGVDVASLPAGQCIVPLELGARACIGRQHQFRFFEGLVGNKHPFWPFISRSHLELVPHPDMAGTVEVCNLSVNPVLMDDHTLTTGTQITVELPVDIGFLANLAGKPDIFLQLRLELGSRGGSAGASVELSCVGSSPANGYASPSEIATATGSIPASSATGSPPGVSRSFSLELSGSAVREGVPLERRQLIFPLDELMLGRAHQRRLHAEALRDGVSSWVSRDHFKIYPASEGFHVVALTSNPMWHVRGGKQSVFLKGQGSVSLASGDSLLLYTGATDGTPDGPGGLGTLQWTFSALGTAEN